ncbi:MAG: MarR family transcriptional regulator [Bacteroidota bacterium]
MAASNQAVGLPRQLRFNLLSACSFVNNGARQLLEPFDLTPKQYDILLLLEENDPEPLSIQNVRKKLADKMSDASRLIDRLHKKGLLEKTPSSEDRRSNLVQITDKGKALLEELSAKYDSIDQQIDRNLDKKQLDQLNELLEKLVTENK